MSSTTTPDVTYEELHQRFAGVFARIAETAAAREQNRELAFDAVRWLREARFGALRVPVALGGLGASLPQLFRLLVELGTADSNLPQIFRAHFGFVEGRLSSRDQASRDYWLAKVVDGQLWGAAMAERTASTGNSVALSAASPGNPQAGWLLDGEKYYCTGTLYADWIAAVALEGDDFVSVAVPTDAQGVAVVDDWDGFGQRLTGSGTTRFNAVKVPDQHIIRRFQKDEVRAESYLTAYYQLFHLAALAGIANAVLRDATEFVKGRTRAFGFPGQASPKDDPLVQQVIGRLSSLAYSAQTQVLAVAELVQQVYDAEQGGYAEEQHYTEAEVRTFQIQQIVLGQVLDATTLLFEVGGASATSESRRLDRHWRNARTLASHNPAIYRERVLGNYYLNGVTPDAAWLSQQTANGQTGAARDEASAV